MPTGFRKYLDGFDALSVTSGERLRALGYDLETLIADIGFSLKPLAVKRLFEGRRTGAKRIADIRDILSSHLAAKGHPQSVIDAILTPTWSENKNPPSHNKSGLVYKPGLDAFSKNAEALLLSLGYHTESLNAFLKWKLNEKSLTKIFKGRRTLETRLRPIRGSLVNFLLLEGKNPDVVQRIVTPTWSNHGPNE